MRSGRFDRASLSARRNRSRPLRGRTALRADTRSGGESTGCDPADSIGRRSAREPFVGGRYAAYGPPGRHSLWWGIDRMRSGRFHRAPLSARRFVGGRYAALRPSGPTLALVGNRPDAIRPIPPGAAQRATVRRRPLRGLTALRADTRWWGIDRMRSGRFLRAVIPIHPSAFHGSRIMVRAAYPTRSAVVGKP